MGQLGTVGGEGIFQLVALHVAQDGIPQAVQRSDIQRVQTHHQDQAGTVQLHGGGFAVGKAAQGIGGTVLGEGSVHVALGQQFGLDIDRIRRELAIQHGVDVRQGGLGGCG